MKRLFKFLPFLLIPVTVFVSGCENQAEKVVNNKPVALSKNPEWAKDAVIYEVNTRQFTEEGTFAAFASHLPRLKELGVDILVIADADELFSSSLRSKIIDSFKNLNTDGVAFSIWHLYDEKQYIHFWETKINGVDMIDPHTRIIKRGRHFVPLFEDGSHPILEPTKRTVCFNGHYHFHLKYHHKSTLPNYSIYFLPERLRKEDVLPYFRPLPFELPNDVRSAISLVGWDSIPPYKETPHHSSERVKFTDPSEALIHPKDKKIYDKS